MAHIFQCLSLFVVSIFVDCRVVPHALLSSPFPPTYVRLYVFTYLYTHSQMAIINKISDWQTCILTNKDVWIDQNQIDQAIYLCLFIHCNVMYVYTYIYIYVVRVSLSSAIYGPDDLRLTENKEIQHKLIKCTHTNIYIYIYIYVSTFIHSFSIFGIPHLPHPIITDT